MLAVCTLVVYHLPKITEWRQEEAKKLVMIEEKDKWRQEVSKKLIEIQEEVISLRESVTGE